MSAWAVEVPARHRSFQTRTLLYFERANRMKTFRFLLLFAALVTPVLADEKTEAQPPPLDLPGSSGLPEKPAQTSKPAFTEPLPLIPDAPPPMTDNPGSLEDRKREVKKTGRKGPPGTVQERIHLRELKTKALADGTLQGQWDLAQRAQTNNGKRAALKKYYVMFYDRMGRLDPQLKAKMEEKKVYVLAHFDSARLKPSELIEDELPLEAGKISVND